MTSWPNLPYELIGRFTVVFFISALLMVVGGLLIVTFLKVWVRGWKWLSNRMWEGYDPDGESPPLWKMRVSWIAYALSRFQFRKIPAAWKEATELANHDLTAHKTLLKGTRNIFADESDMQGNGDTDNERTFGDKGQFKMKQNNTDDPTVTCSNGHTNTHEDLDEVGMNYYCPECFEVVNPERR